MQDFLIGFWENKTDDKFSHLFCKVRDWCLWVYLPSDVKSQHFVENIQQSFKKRSMRDAVLHFKMIIETRKWGSTCHLRTWIIQVCFLLHAIFYHKIIIKDYSIHVLKAILWAKTPKTIQTFFELYTWKAQRQPSQKFWPKILTLYFFSFFFFFFYSNLYLHFLRLCCENIFKFLCTVPEKIGN